MLKGLLASGITVGVAAVFPQTLVFPFFVAVLGIVAGVGPGVAMGKEEEGRPLLEWSLAFLILATGLAGLWATPFLLAAAWGLHGGLALARSLTALGDGMPEGLSGFFVTYDAVLTGFVFYLCAVGGGVPA